MLRSRLSHIIVSVLLLLAISPAAFAQFKSEAFSNGFGKEGDATEPSDSVETTFSLKEYMGGLAHKNELKIGTMAGGSFVFIGGCQIYNKQYWKLPLVYGSIGAGVGGGLYYRNQYQKSLDAYNSALEIDPNTTLTPDNKANTLSKCMFAGAALAYWGTLMDGVVSYKVDTPHHAGKATLYSLLVPGLGQVYNGEYWKVPIYWGALSTSCAFYSINKINYERFRRIYNEATDADSTYKGSITASTALYYRNIYRRYRDYSVLAIAASYLLQVIDANVFSYMQDFEVNDDISMEVRPTVISPDTQYAFSGGSTAFGFSVGLRF